LSTHNIQLIDRDLFNLCGHRMHHRKANPEIEPELELLELEPDAWQRFERAVDVVAKSPPQHKTKSKKKRGKAKMKPGK
jgi:hypothetical protein